MAYRLGQGQNSFENQEDLELSGKLLAKLVALLRKAEAANRRLLISWTKMKQ
jgi:hypothetical protein